MCLNKSRSAEIHSGQRALTAHQVSEAAGQGDELAKEAFGRAGEFIGQATADFLHIFNPSILIFGGGVTLSGALLLDPLKDSMRRHVMESILSGWGWWLQPLNWATMPACSVRWRRPTSNSPNKPLPPHTERSNKWNR